MGIPTRRFGLIVTFDPANYKAVFPHTDLSNYKYISQKPRYLVDNDDKKLEAFNQQSETALSRYADESRREVCGKAWAAIMDWRARPVILSSRVNGEDGIPDKRPLAVLPTPKLLDTGLDLLLDCLRTGGFVGDGDKIIVEANEGTWRNVKNIHLKAPVGNIDKYLEVLRGVLDQNHCSVVDDSEAEKLQEDLSTYHAIRMAPYLQPPLEPLVQNRTLLSAADQVLAGDPGFFNVEELPGAVVSGKAVTWYGCHTSPHLVATLEGTAVNGLGVGQVLDCMKKLWGSELAVRLGGEKKTLSWILVPCFVTG